MIISLRGTSSSRACRAISLSRSATRSRHTSGPVFYGRDQSEIIPAQRRMCVDVLEPRHEVCWSVVALCSGLIYKMVSEHFGCK
jgi:hypothetical protein